MKILKMSVCFLVCLAAILPVTTVYAFPVEPLPEDNLVTNPWFRSYSNPNHSSLDGWIDAAGKDKHWSSSQKESNPSPEIIQSGVCGHKDVYCGTAARLSPQPGQSGGVAEEEVDSYLYQVVTADSDDRKLKFFTHWVSHRVEIAEVTIYGGSTQEGPWTSVWVPLSFSIIDEAPESPTGNRADEWVQTEIVETIVPNGYPFYKIEIHVRLPEARHRIGDIGFKITGIYFATDIATESDLLAPTPTLKPTETSIAEEMSTPTSEATRTRMRIPTPTITETPDYLPTMESKPTTSLALNPGSQISVTPTIQSSNIPASTDEEQLISKGDYSAQEVFVMGFATASLVFTIAFMVIYRARRN